LRTDWSSKGKDFQFMGIFFWKGWLKGVK
jgi:hypothetical protein